MQKLNVQTCCCMFQREFMSYIVLQTNEAAKLFSNKAKSEKVKVYTSFNRCLSWCTPSVVRLLKVPLISSYVGIVSILANKYNSNSMVLKINNNYYYLWYKHNSNRILSRSKNTRDREILLSPHAPASAQCHTYPCLAK